MIIITIGVRFMFIIHDENKKESQYSRLTLEFVHSGFVNNNLVTNAEYEIRKSSE